MRRRAVVIAFRLGFGLLTLAALGTQFALHIQHGFSVVNFFSYFTNLSNILAALLFILVTFLLVGWAVVGAGNLRRRQQSAAASRPGLAASTSEAST